MTPEQLDAIQARYDGAQIALSSDAGTLRQLHRLTESANDVPALLAYARDLEARNQRVRELHPMTCDFAGQNCEAVSDHSMKCTMLVCGPCGESWPCPTVAALIATEACA